jgi:type IX secretion system PorP/SprF family membrane protein
MAAVISFLRKTLSFVFFLVIFHCRAQDPLFSGSAQTLLYLNPSYAGTNGFCRLQGDARIQDKDDSLGFVSAFGSTDFFILPMKAGVGLTWLYDNYHNGVIRTQAVGFTYAQHVWLYSNELRLIPSLQINYIQRTPDLTAITNSFAVSEARYDPSLVINKPNAEALPSAKSNVDLNAGLLFQGRNMSAGLSLNHLSRPDVGLYGIMPLPFRIMIHGAYNMKLKHDTRISFFGWFMNQATKNDAYINCNIWMAEELFAGVGFRKSNAIVFNAGFQVSAMRIGFVYERGLKNTTSVLYAKNAFEVFLGFYLKTKRSDLRADSEWRYW